jgi:predicted dehydrogenase
MSKKRFKIGIAGLRGLTYMPGFLDMPDVEISAFCELNEELLNKKAAEFSIPQTFRIYEDMLNSDIDAVFIATPMNLHATQVIQALDADKHVLCEVTAGTNINELFWLKERVERSNKIYMMCENYAYRPDIVLAGKLAKQGFFGDIYYAESEYIEDLKSWLVYANGKPSWRQTWQVGKRGAFYPTHCIGPIMKCLGDDDRITEVSCFGVGPYTAPEYRQEDTTTTILRTKKGRLLQMRIDCLSNRPNQIFYLALQGTRGAIESPRGPLGQQSMYRAYTCNGGIQVSKGLVWEDFWNYSHLLPENYRNMPAGAREFAKNGDYHTWGGDYFVVQDFVRTLRGEIEVPVNIYEACEWSAVALLAELSAENNGKPIKMPDFHGSRKDMELHI